MSMKNYADIKVIAFLMLGISLISTIAGNLGMLTTEQMLIISVASIIVMMSLIIFMIYKIRKAIKVGMLPESFESVKTIIPKANVNNKFILANSDVFNKNIIPTNPLRRCVFRISMEINSSIEQLGVSVIRFRESKTVENKIQKNFVANESYIIDTVVLPDETLNFKFDKDIDIKKMLVDELYIP